MSDGGQTTKKSKEVVVSFPFPCLLLSHSSLFSPSVCVPDRSPDAAAAPPAEAVHGTYTRCVYRQFPLWSVFPRFLCLPQRISTFCNVIKKDKVAAVQNSGSQDCGTLIANRDTLFHTFLHPLCEKNIRM